MSLHNLQIYLNEIALRPVPSTFETISAQPSSLDWTTSLCRTEALIQCVETARSYLDHYLTLSVNNFTFLEHIKSFYSLLAISAYAAGLASQILEGLDTEKSTDYYISGMIDQVSGLVTIDNSKEQVDFFWQLKITLNYARSWFFENGKECFLHQGSSESEFAVMFQSGAVGDAQHILGHSLQIQETEKMWNGEMLDDSWQLGFDLDPHSLLIDGSI